MLRGTLWRSLRREERCLVGYICEEKSTLTPTLIIALHCNNTEFITNSSYKRERKSESETFTQLTVRMSYIKAFFTCQVHA